MFNTHSVQCRSSTPQACPLSVLLSCLPLAMQLVCGVCSFDNQKLVQHTGNSSSLSHTGQHTFQVLCNSRLPLLSVLLSCLQSAMRSLCVAIRLARCGAKSPGWRLRLLLRLSRVTPRLLALLALAGPLAQRGAPVCPSMSPSVTSNPAFA